MIELLQFEFMQRAFVVATVTGALCAVIGVYIVLRGMSFIGAGVAHASFGGVALGFFTGLNPFFTAVLFCTAVAWGIGLVSESNRLREDTAVGIFFASTMALGVLLIGSLKGYTIDLFGYMFGNVLAVTVFDMWAAIILSVIVFGTIILLFKEFFFLTFDSEAARVAGLPVRFLNYLMLTLIAVTIVMSIKAVGIVLVSALLVAPAAAAHQLTDDFKKMMLLSVLIGVASTWIGLFLSSWFDIASGATIVLTATIVFFVCSAFSPNRRSARRRMLALRKNVNREAKS
ncbi:metal ABC transporter permease [candidate division KSB1 bacterium]|nr:metal ABC transporter permease [candidate division KSB1 bacterium]RQW04399.1 MAG: metal ABC transporter permease [candidate division KSB1 bacterium]